MLGNSTETVSKLALSVQVLHLEKYTEVCPEIWPKMQQPKFSHFLIFWRHVPEIQSQWTISAMVFI